MSKKLSPADLKGIQPEVIDALTGVTQVATLATPLIKQLFDWINDLVANIGSKNPNSPKNVRIRLALLETKDSLQKELNKRQEETNKRQADFNKLVTDKLGLTWNE